MKWIRNILALVLFTVAFQQLPGQSNEYGLINTLKNTSCLLVEKPFIAKDGKATGWGELYLRCSVQDYFIKFCEGNITKKELEPFLNEGITLDFEVYNGEWDSCPGDSLPIQSRVGYYAIIQSIKND